MHWPWRNRNHADLLVASWADQTLAFVRAVQKPRSQFEVTSFGVERQGSDSPSDFARRLETLGLKGSRAQVMLVPPQYQWLQIDAPGVAPEELRSAARYQIREMLDTHVDDVTLDVMRVGDGQQKGTARLFVIAAANAALRDAMALGELLRWNIPVVDVQETAQRNLQNALALTEGRPQRANAALVLLDDAQAILTICANDELFYTRRLDIPQGFMTSNWGAAGNGATPLVDAYAPVGEYVPDYGVGGVSYGSDYSTAARVDRASANAPASLQNESAQRFLVEVQRSLDLWDRSWSSMPLAVVRVHAGARTQELADWLTRELGQSVDPMDIGANFSGFAGGTTEAQAKCWPLLGTLMREESRAL
jgi:MSHA biogenesis protein MshI